MTENTETTEGFEPNVNHYELAFHLRADLEESATKTKAQTIEGLVSGLGGKIKASSEPKRQHLSYPINHQKYAYFGTVNFQSVTEQIDELNNKLKLDSDILRFLLIKTLENPRILHSLGGKERDSRIHKPRTLPESKPVVEVKPEVMEKQLEEVIGNI